MNYKLVEIYANPIAECVAILPFVMYNNVVELENK